MTRTAEAILVAAALLSPGISAAAEENKGAVYLVAALTLPTNVPEIGEGRWSNTYHPAPGFGFEGSMEWRREYLGGYVSVGGLAREIEVRTEYWDGQVDRESESQLLGYLATGLNFHLAGSKGADVFFGPLLAGILNVSSYWDERHADFDYMIGAQAGFALRKRPAKWNLCFGLRIVNLPSHRSFARGSAVSIMVGVSRAR